MVDGNCMNNLFVNWLVTVVVIDNNNCKDKQNLKINVENKAPIEKGLPYTIVLKNFLVKTII